MQPIGLTLSSVAGLVNLVCFILVVIQMFQHGETGWGVACIVLALCCGLGGLVAFIYGWTKANQWGITNIMTVWTVAVVLGMVGGVMNPALFQQLPHIPGAH